MNIIDDKFLTEREKQIILLLLHGKNKREIAEHLYISISTVKTFMENIYRKFNVHNKVELTIYLIKNKIVNLGDNPF